MPIEFKHSDGALKCCRRCDYHHFVHRMGIIEMLEAQNKVYAFNCPDCKYGNRINLSELRGHHDKSLYRMTVKRR